MVREKRWNGATGDVAPFHLLRMGTVAEGSKSTCRQNRLETEGSHIHSNDIPETNSKTARRKIT